MNAAGSEFGSGSVAGEKLPGQDWASGGPDQPDQDASVVEQAQQPALVEWTAASRTGSVSVRTTEQGLPLGISLDRAELRRDPGALASEILRLCKQAANRAALARREELGARGLSPEGLRRMGLPTPEEVAQSELRDEDEYDTEPESWLRSV